MKIAGYEIQREIGRSVYATVFLATQVASGRQVAIKRLSPALALDEDFAEHFRLEMKAAAKFSHNNINPIIEIGDAGGQYYVVCAYAENGNLNQRIAAGLSMPEILVIVRQIARALAELHKQGYVHGNIKAGNILIDDQGKALLGDLGIAQVLDGNSVLSAMGVSLATDTYVVAPEDLRGEELDISSDQYAFGALIYQCCSGRVPYADPDLMRIAWQHCHAPAPTLPSEHALMQPLLDRLMAKDRGQRFAATEEILIALNEVQSAYAAGSDAATVSHLSQAPGHSRRASRPSRRRRGRSTVRAVMITLILLLTFAGVIAASYVWVERETILSELLSSPLAKRADDKIPARPKHIIDDQAQAMSAPAVAGDDSVKVTAADTAPASAEPPFSAQGLEPEAPDQLQAVDTPVDNSPTDTTAATAAPGELPKLSLISVGRRPATGAEAPVAESAAAENTFDDNLEMDTPDAGLSTGLDADLSMEIDLLLQEGDRQSRILRLTTPPGDNAYETYRKILALDPYNVEARLGIARIVATYVSLARRKLDQGLYAEGLVRIRSGLRIDPDNKQLLALKAAVEEELVRYRGQTDSPPGQANSVIVRNKDAQRNPDGTFSRLLSQPAGRDPSDF